MFPFDHPENIRKAKVLGGSKENIGKNGNNENNFEFPWNLISYPLYILKWWLFNYQYCSSRNGKLTRHWSFSFSIKQIRLTW